MALVKLSMHQGLYQKRDFIPHFHGFLLFVEKIFLNISVVCKNLLYVKNLLVNCQSVAELFRRNTVWPPAHADTHALQGASAYKYAANVI